MAQTPKKTPRALQSANPVWVSAAFVLAFAVVMMPFPALAYGTPMGEVLCYVLYIILGNAGRGLATIGVSVIGVAALLGKASWGLALTVGVGIAVVFGCVNIVWVLGLGTAQC